MIKNLFTTALRNLVKNKFTTAINIFGLSMGISAFLLLFLYIYNEATYDHFHQKYRRIYRLSEDDLVYTKGNTVPYLLQEFPEIESATRWLDWSLHKVASNQFEKQQQVIYADTAFFKIFSFEFIEGNPEQALHEKFGIVLSKKMAHNYFGDQPALNQTLVVDHGEHQLIVTGVVNDIPDNSTLKFGLITSYETGFALDPWLTMVHDWYNTFSPSYVLLHEEADPKALEVKFIPFVEKNFLTGEERKPTLNLVPLADLRDKLVDNQAFTYLLMGIAISIALIAIFNFINLFTESSKNRVREIGMRKTMGASGKQLTSLFLGEALLTSFLAISVGILISYLLLPYYNELFESNLSLDFSNPWLVGFAVMLWLLAGLFSGSIPAIQLASRNTLNSLKGRITPNRSNQGIRYGMMVAQFTIITTLIAGTLIINQQISFMKNHRLNFDADQIVVLETNLWNYQDQEAGARKIKRFVEALANDSQVASVTTSAHVPGRYVENFNQFYTNGWAVNDVIQLRKVNIGTDYFNTYGIRFTEGGENRQLLENDSNAVVINEAALRALGAKNAVESYLFESQKNGTPFRIVGVVEDYHYQGLHRKIEPLIHFYDQHMVDNPDYVSVRFNPGNLGNALENIKNTWDKLPPVKEMDYFFADDEIESQYQFVTRTSTLSAYFSAVAIIIASLGLLAMTIYLINNKVKEIGIRKVVGASTANLVSMLTLQSLKWLALSMVVAIPLAYFLMHKWLQDFAYRTEIGWENFLYAVSLALLVALITISSKTIKAALANPVESLRNE